MELSIRVSHRAEASQNHQGGDSRDEFTVVTGQIGCFYRETPEMQKHKAEK